MPSGRGYQDESSDGPDFQLYDEDIGSETEPLYRCSLLDAAPTEDHHFLYTTDPDCEGNGSPDKLLGYIVTTSGHPGCGMDRVWRMYKGSITNHFLANSSSERQNALSLDYVEEDVEWYVH
jgi:hypothetical protein